MEAREAEETAAAMLEAPALPPMTDTWPSLTCHSSWHSAEVNSAVCVCVCVVGFGMGGLGGDGEGSRGRGGGRKSGGQGGGRDARAQRRGFWAEGGWERRRRPGTGVCRQIMGCWHTVAAGAGAGDPVPESEVRRQPGRDPGIARHSAAQSGARFAPELWLIMTTAPP